MKKSVQVVKFCLIGAVNTGVDVIVFTILTFFGMHYLAAQCISYVCGGFNSYLMNRTWTFQRPGTSNRYECVKFLAVSCLTLLLTSGLLTLLYDDARLPILLCKCIATGAGVSVNYLGSRLWVFRESLTSK